MAMATLGFASHATAEVYEFDVAKFRVYEQNSVNPPASPVGYLFNTYLEASSGDASLVTLNGMPIVQQYPGEWELFDQFGTQGELDAAYPSGVAYTMVLSGGVLGNRSETLSFPPESYPAPPVFTAASFNGMQNANPNEDLLIEWAAPGAGTNLVQFTIYDPDSDENIVDYEVPVDNNYLVPASLLQPNHTYEVQLLFGNGIVSPGSPAPGFGAGANQIAAFVSGTKTMLTTGSGGVLSVDAGVFKGVGYQQTDPGVQPSTPIGWYFDGFADPGPGLISGAEIVGGAMPIALQEYIPGSWDTDGPDSQFGSLASLDAAFPSNNIYTMYLFSSVIGDHNQDFLIGSDSYPAPPYLVGPNLDDLINADPMLDFYLLWNVPDASVSAISVSIEQTDTGNSVLDTLLDPLTITLPIPAGTLQAGVQYELTITFANATIGVGDPEPGFGSGVTIASGFLSTTQIPFMISDGLGCQPDLNGDGLLDFFDVSAFLVAYQSQDPIADFNHDGLFDFFDVSAFLVAYQAGCP